MAQRPWEILKSRYVGLEEATEFVAKSIRDLKASAPTPSTPSNSPKRRRVESKALPCSDQALDSLSKLHHELEECFRNKRKRRVLEPDSKPTDNGKRGSASDATSADSHLYLFKKCVVRGLAQLLPLYLKHPDFGVKLFLSNFLMSLVPELGGVWIAFRKVRSPNNKGFVADAEKLGVICFKIDLEVLVFCPSPGSTLLGTVENIRPNAIQASVFGAWVCQIPSSQFMEGSKLIERAENSNTHDNDEGIERLIATERIIQITDPINPSAPPKEIKVGSPIKFLLLRAICGSADGKDFYTLKGTLRRNPRLHRLQHKETDDKA
eukprot:Protomagalhaensia_wolfi_Nauph_80__2899@NODE_298_length_2861_cov_180_339830_g222_i0_p2_GENE_NODE_298_length_2861_cov_180_339830_g222_i0NODE_298_length_2861_cov_180_339830_g222_i0_p2_ORF_typecomplete_len322_score31_91RPA43_OB/PF17875_1/0_041_NODE_298_length_2861_cov_180_339830_g222_i017902755